MQRLLLLVSTTSYRTDAFLAAARRLDAEVIVGSDRCHVLDGILSFGDGSIVLDLRHPETAARQIVAALADRPVDAIVPTSDATAHIAALASRALGLTSNPPDAAYTARNKLRMREVLSAAGVPCPRFAAFSVAAASSEVARGIVEGPGFPCVLKPLLLSASRGVMRVDDELGLARALERLRAMLTTPEQRAAALEDPDGARVLVEEFIAGAEVAVEGVLANGRFFALAIFDKPDPLDGPFFEETIYVTPSRHPAAVQQALVETTAAAAAAMGLLSGPVHAELRVGPDGVPSVIEVAARTIGGLCARALRFSLGTPSATADPPADLDDDSLDSLEALVVGMALGRFSEPPQRRAGASGVMMIPIPRAGVLQAVHGEAEARAVPHVVDVTITVRAGERLVPLPEGSSYLGFLFARASAAEGPATVEEALRAAHRCLRFDVATLIS